MDAIFVLAIFVGGVDLFACKHSREADCDDFRVTAYICNAWSVYFDSERGYGWFNNLINSRRNDEFLGCNWKLSLDFFHKLSCQYRDA